MITPGNVRVMRRRRLSFAGLLLCSATLAVAADSTVLLRVEGAVKTPLALTAEDLAQMPRTTAQFERDGKTSTYEGVLLYDILVKAGVPLGRDMRGKPMASYILATARDGYQVVFAIPEVDPAFEGARVLVADKRDGGPLPPSQRPLQLIAPQDKLHARSVWSLIKIEIIRLRP
jgi:DMSO/TMAO reductase YedYZ molybdopterin-dependent catalytic subunit